MQNEEINQPEIAAQAIEEKVETSPVPVQPTPNNPPWNSLVAVFVWIWSVLLVLLLPPIFVAPYLFKQSIDFSDKRTVSNFLKTDPTAISISLASIIVVHLLTTITAWLVVTKFRNFSFRQTLGWDWGGFRIWHAFAISVFFYLLIIGLTKTFGDVENDFDTMLKNAGNGKYLVAFFATFTAPLVEEVIYRGILYSALQRTFGIILAVVGVTILFAAVHVPQYSVGGAPDYATISALLLLSLVLTLIRVKTDNLLPCIVLHTVFNGIQSVLLILQPYLPTDPTLNPEQVGALFRLFN